MGGQDCFYYENYLSTTDAKDMAFTFAAGRGGTVSCAKQGGTVLAFNTVGVPQDETRLLADVSWISPYPHEREWLMVHRMHAPFPIHRRESEESSGVDLIVVHSSC